jgi:hypothetical protein
LALKLALNLTGLQVELEVSARHGGTDHDVGVGLQNLSHLLVWQKWFFGLLLQDALHLPNGKAFV